MAKPKTATGNPDCVDSRPDYGDAFLVRLFPRAATEREPPARNTAPQGAWATAPTVRPSHCEALGLRGWEPRGWPPRARRP